MKHIKCVCVGDKISDKTRLLITYTTGCPPGEYTPTVFDNYSSNVFYKDTMVNLQLWDTAGGETYKKLRPLSYPQTDIFVIAFSLVNLITLQNILNIWLPEIKEHCPGTPYILVGTKKEIRDNFDQHKKEYLSKGYEPIQTSVGISMKERIQADGYIECSTDDVDSVRPVFDLAIKCAFEHTNEEEDEINKKKVEQNKKSINDEFLKVGFFGDEKSGKKEIALKYVYDDFVPNQGKIDNNDFFKVVEIHNVIRKLKFEIDFPYDLSEIDGFIFIFNGNDENSLNSLREMIDSQNKMGIKFKPHVLVANYGNEEKRMRNYETVSELIKNLECEYIEINSTLDDIERAFYYLFKAISKESVIHKDKVKKKKKAIKNKK